MGVFKKANKIRKMRQRQKAFEKTNPEMAKRLEGKIAAMKGLKEH